MSVLTRTTRRIASAAAIGALGIAIALGTTACGAGKISQTNNQAPAVNGASGNIMLGDVSDDGVAEDEAELAGNSIALRNVQVMFPVDKADQVFGEGGPFKINFTIANDSPVYYVKLTGIKAPQGKVEFVTDAGRSTSPGDAGKIGPGGHLTAGVPSNVSTEQAEQDGISRLDVEATGTGSTIAAGLTVPLTFTFEVTGLDGKNPQTKSTTVNTPVDSTAIDERADVVRDRQPAEGHH